MTSQEANGKFEADSQTKVLDSNVPEWLKPEIFEDVLKQTVEGYKKVKDFKAKSALAPGENYSTIMLRIEIEVETHDGNTKSISYMIKLGHDNEMYNELLEKRNMFDLESDVFMILVPEMEQIFKDAGKDIKFCAKCYKLPIEKNHVLLEDLRPRGFKNADRLEGLDIEHTKSVLKKLAEWHAVSATRIEKVGMYEDMYVEGFFLDFQKSVIKQYNEAMGNSLLKSLKALKRNDSYIECLEPLIGKTVDLLYEAGKVDPNEFNVLNHGDCWTNNIMFQYDDNGKLIDTYFVDLQMPKYGTPAQDLLYFLLSSTNLDIKLKQFEYFIRYYHEELVKNLKLLGYPKKIPTLKDIHRALYKYGIWGYNTMIGVMAAALLEPNKDAHFEKVLNDTEDALDFRQLMFTNDRYRKHADAILPWLHNRGALEC